MASWLTSGLRAGPLAVLALAMAGCIAVHSENVTHGPGRVPGYSIEYVEAMPRPGTPVIEGTVVKFSVKVSYLLMKSERGRLQLQFADQHGQPLLEGKVVAVEIKRTGWETAELSQEVTIPPERWDLILRVYVVPEGEPRPSGELRLRYPVASPRKDALAPK
jgi:hypothetical protein